MVVLVSASTLETATNRRFQTRRRRQTLLESAEIAVAPIHEHGRCTWQVECDNAVEFRAVTVFHEE
jgi:hypothetical protein